MTETERAMAWAGLGIGIISAAALLYLDTVGLRWAHLYRQSRFDVGLIPFIWVGAGMLAASLPAATAIGLLLYAAPTAPRDRRRILRGAAAALAILLGGSAVWALWVASVGDRCFGPCG